MKQTNLLRLWQYDWQETTLVRGTSRMKADCNLNSYNVEKKSTEAKASERRERANSRPRPVIFLPAKAR
jgi:hypothetical protein